MNLFVQESGLCVWKSSCGAHFQVWTAVPNYNRFTLQSHSDKPYH